MTTTPLSLDNAMQLASEAFLPCGCVTSANPEDDSFGFTVMNGSGEEITRVARQSLPGVRGTNSSQGLALNSPRSRADPRSPPKTAS